MKSVKQLLLIGWVCVSSFVCSIQAQVTSGNIVGYYNYSFYSGDNLFHNNLWNQTNTLSTLFGLFTPENTTISLWSASLSAFQPASAFVGGEWTVDLTLTPGMAARLNTSLAFTNTFVGEVRCRKWLGSCPAVACGRGRFLQHRPGP